MSVRAPGNFRPGTVTASWRRVAKLVLVGLALYGGGVATSWWIAATTGRAEPATARSAAPLLWQAWNLAESRYVDTSALNSKLMIYGAITGMLQALGDTDHTRFLSPTDVQQERSQLSGRFVGIGIQVNLKNGRPVVVAPLPGSPAQKAGLRADDVILTVNGKETAQMTLTQLGQQIRGPAGSSVQLRILRPADQKSFDVTLTRASIVAPAIESKQFVVGATPIVQIHVIEFSANADAELHASLRDAANARAAVILDLRDNPGGLLEQAVAVSSEFLRGGNVLLQQDRSGTKRPVPVTPGGIATTVPLVVLVNEGTASAAEITAGAIQDARRATLVGATTFGTGTVLSTFSLSDGSEVLLGTEEWLTPDGTQIWRHGVVPDQAVALPASVTPLYPSGEAKLTGDQIANGSDAQLVRAIQDLAQASPATASP